jgi:hypothetical protein
VRDDERQRIFMFRANVNEMDIESVDLGDELRQSVEFRLAFAPIIVFATPIARELLHHRKWHALRVIGDRFPFRPPCRVYAPAQFGKFRFRNVNFERADCVTCSRRVRLRGDQTGRRHGCRGGKNFATNDVHLDLHG